MNPFKAVGLSAMIALGAWIGSPASAQTPPKVVVVPLVRSCAFQLRLDQIAPTLYSPTEHGPLYDPAHRAALEWRPLGSATWKKAQDFVRVQADRWNKNAVPEPRMATMLFGLKEGETYEYRVSFQGTGFPAEAYTGQFTTKTVEVPHGTAPTVSITTSTKNPYLAIKAMLKTTANTNAVIQLEPQKDATGKPVRTVFRTPIASYYDTGMTAFNWSGSPTGWLSIQGAPGAEIVVDGSDPAYDVVNKGMWQVYTDAGLGIKPEHRIYRTVAKFFDPANPEKQYSPSDPLRPAPGQVYYEKEVGGDAYRLLNLLKGTKWGGSGENTSLGLPTMLARAKTEPMGGSFSTDDQGYVYVHLHNGIDPNTVNMKIAVWKACLDLSTAKYVRVNNIRFQYFRGTTGQPFGGVHLDNMEHVRFDNCGFKGLGYSIGMRVAYHTPRKDVVIHDCTFNERGNYPEKNPATGKWEASAWLDLKGGREDDHAIYMVGQGVSVLDCSFQGSFNGITSEVSPEFFGAPDWTPDTVYHSECWEIDNNSFFGIGDDCVEVETYAVCIAATRNRIERSYKGWSAAPNIGGPQYFLRNTFLGRGEYGDIAYKQAMTKFGNNDPNDTAYKLFANNSGVNVNDDATGRPLVGLSSSGATYNLFCYNNYIACDAYPIEWGDGVLGFPHVFNGNRYVAKRQKTQMPGYGTWDCIFMGWRSYLQGETLAFRVSKTWEDWQRGRDVREGVPFPGYQASPADPWAYIHDTHDAARPWIHDPDSKYSDGTHSLVNPYAGDFRPRPDSDAIGQGVPLANVTFDCGPGWTVFEEAGRPTAGALTAGVPVTPRPNEPPTISVQEGVKGTTGLAVRVGITYADVDGTVTRVDTTVRDANGQPVTFAKDDSGSGAAWVTFTAAKAGSYVVAATATDDKAASASSSATAVVADPPVYNGSVTVTGTASNPTPRPGEPVTYTIVCENASNHTAVNAVLTYPIPEQLVLSTGSATLDGAHVSLAVSATQVQLPLGDMPPGAKHTVVVTAYVK